MTIHYLKAHIKNGELILVSENGNTLTVENAEAKEFFLRATEAKNISSNLPVSGSYCECGTKQEIEQVTVWKCKTCRKEIAI